MQKSECLGGSYRENVQYSMTMGIDLVTTNTSLKSIIIVYQNVIVTNKLAN